MKCEMAGSTFLCPDLEVPQRVSLAKNGMDSLRSPGGFTDAVQRLILMDLNLLELLRMIYSSSVDHLMCLQGVVEIVMSPRILQRALHCTGA